MLLVTLMWSIAGVVTRWLDGAGGFEMTFWRSAANALALVRAAVLAARAGACWRHRCATGGRALWLSGACWCVMFTAFMMALSLTTVANVLVTMALAPLFTALVARLALGHRLPATHLGRHRAGRRRHRLDVRPRAAAAASTCWAPWWRSACPSPPPSTGR